MYTVGQRVELISTADPYTHLRSGDQGVIDWLGAEPSPFMRERQIGVKWDSGSTLILLEGIDRFKVIE